MNSKPTVISFFAGGGGSSLGYHLAGYKELLAVDFEKNAVETLKLNFPELLVWHKDIKEVTVSSILETCNISKGELDILDGSPPCQGFSTAGKRKINDSRNYLFEEFVRIVNGLEPKVFVMENVPGMIKGKMKGSFNEILRELKKLNYNVKCKLMNSKYYNVPQSRNRLIFIGVRKDLNIEPSYPQPSNDITNVKKALKDVLPYKAGKLTDMELSYWNKMKIGESGSKYNSKGHWFGYIKIHPNKPCPTVIKSASNGLVHWEEKRHMACNELQVLCSFPETYKFVGNEKNKIDRIGNAVMPNMMKAIAENIKEKILKR